MRRIHELTRGIGMHEYTHLMRSVIYENIYETHFDTCNKEDCFCHHFKRSNGFNWEELQGY